jgi:hypothetical protein
MDFSILPAVDAQHEMLEWGKINVCEKLHDMYRGAVLSSPLDVLLSHHLFVPIFAVVHGLTVSIARPVKNSLMNPNYICSTCQGFLLLISIV